MTAHVSCECGMVSDITVSLLAGAAVHANIHTLSAAAAQMSVDGTIVTDAKRIGSCDYHAK